MSPPEIFAFTHLLASDVQHFSGRLQGYRAFLNGFFCWGSYLSEGMEKENTV